MIFFIRPFGNKWTRVCFSDFRRAVKKRTDVDDDFVIETILFLLVSPSLAVFAEMTHARPSVDRVIGRLNLVLPTNSALFCASKETDYRHVTRRPLSYVITAPRTDVRSTAIPSDVRKIDVAAAS